jgi:hypothetical protein
MEGDISSLAPNRKEEGHRLKRYWDKYYLFCHDNREKNSFWPFVKFYENNSQLNEYSPNGAGGPNIQYYDTYIREFRGIFYKYDISEFLFYSVIIFAILFFRFENNKTKPQNKTS